MKLHNRLLVIASLVDKNKQVIDIGCDHGLLDIYLTKYNNNTCIASDINKNALNMAKENFKKYNMDIPLVISDGLDKIEINDEMIAIIAGMGTKTIKHILDNKKSELIDTFIIQTNKDYFELRKYMMLKGYKIVDEIAFFDLKIPYVVMKFEKGSVKYSKHELILGPKLITKEDENTKKFFKYLYYKNIKLISKIPDVYVDKRNELNFLNKIIKNKYNL